MNKRLDYLILKSKNEIAFNKAALQPQKNPANESNIDTIINTNYCTI